jgi:hypothetical protein
MSEAAKQCRKWIEATYPGVRISRKACRNTAGGSVSQHSAYKSGAGSYDSNALDIFGPEELGYDAEREFVAAIVDQLEAHKEEWSIRLVLWDVDRHYGHAHVDFWPTCTEPKWCGRPAKPYWRRSDGSALYSLNPPPENGPYTGQEEQMPLEQWHQLIDTLFAIPRVDGGLHGDADFWKTLDPDDPQWHTDFWPAVGRLWAN